MSAQFNVRAVHTSTLHADDFRHMREILSRTGDKWTFVVLVALRERCMRFNDLHRTIDGVSHRMLVVTLRHLQRDGFIARTVYPSVPPRVEYGLSELGHSLREVLQPVEAWMSDNRPAIEASRRDFDAQAELMEE